MKFIEVFRKLKIGGIVFFLTQRKHRTSKPNFGERSHSNSSVLSASQWFITSPQQPPC
jgi:hypothetical protein